ncbi:MAG TPA: rhomboid family intramembrane serine protease [Opitutaceae bacterium]|jgi:membrane associated rhomboid family serine protease
MSSPAPPIEVAHYPDSETGFDHVLVVLALGVPCWLMPEGAGFSLLVEEPDAERAALELRKYDAESRAWPPPDPVTERPARPLTQAARISALAWALAEILAYRGELASGGRWIQWGELDPAEILRHGQWWRPFTALFLHADPGHLLSNLTAGYFAFCAVLAEFGLRRGWLLVAVAAMAGNAAAAAIHSGAGIDSIGASTAVFAALGLICGEAARAAIAARQPPRALLLPLGAGAALLALFGGGTPDLPVDVAAHAGGFAAGAILVQFAGGRRVSNALIQD